MNLSKKDRQARRAQKKQLKVFEALKLSEIPTTFPVRVKIMKPHCYLLGETAGGGYDGKVTGGRRKIMLQYLYDGVPNFYVVENKEDNDRLNKISHRTYDGQDQERQLILNGNVLCVRGLRESSRGRIWVSRSYLDFEDFEEIDEGTLDSAIQKFCGSSSSTNEPFRAYNVFCPDRDEDVAKLHRAFERAGIEQIVVNYRR